jgi:sulfur-oxidizing protein SoxB
MSSMNRREFLQILAAASAAGFALDARSVWAGGTGDSLYDLKKFGNVHLLHFTDCHAQLLPVYFREPSVNLGVGGAQGQGAAPGRRTSAEGLRHQARRHRGACLSPT